MLGADRRDDCFIPWAALFTPLEMCNVPFCGHKRLHIKRFQEACSAALSHGNFCYSLVFLQSRMLTDVPNYWRELLARSGWWENQTRVNLRNMVNTTDAVESLVDVVQSNSKSTFLQCESVRRSSNFS